MGDLNIGIGKNRTANAIEECTRDGGPSTMVCCRKDEVSLFLSLIEGKGM